MVSAAAVRSRTGARVRVMVVDDSAVVRGLTKRWLEAEPSIEVAAMCTDGKKAVEQIGEVKPDVVILDVEMPHMDGLTALPQLHRIDPHARIVMASTLTREGAATTLRAMSLGAADYIAKPEATSLGGAAGYQRELIEKIKALGNASQSAKSPRPQRPVTQFVRKPERPAIGRAFRPRAVVVASSTGGPQALQTFLPPVAKATRLPILIVQHMPKTFTTILAEKLSKMCGRPCIEPKNGDPIQNGIIYLAPGDYHMRVVRSASGAEVIQLDQGAPVNFCRPAADPMFQSVVERFGGSVLGIVLTGMGHDGRAGSDSIQKAGGRILVQDEATSVVWGMPGAVAEAGLANDIRPLPELPGAAIRFLNGEAK